MPSKKNKKKNKNNNNRLPIGAATPNPEPDGTADQPALESGAVSAEDEGPTVPVRTAPQVHVSNRRASLSDL